MQSGKLERKRNISLNDGNIYVNINTKKSQRQISAKAKEALLNQDHEKKYKEDLERAKDILSYKE